MKNEIRELRDLTDLDTRDIADAPKVLTMLFEGKTHMEIADALGLARQSITVKISRLMDTREFQNALADEWIKRYCKMKVDNPVHAFKMLTRLVAMTITRQYKTTQNVNINERAIVVMASAKEYEESIQAVVQAEIERTIQQEIKAKKYLLDSESEGDNQKGKTEVET